MNTEQNILSSFSMQDILNPQIWEQQDNEYILRPEIKDALLKISEEFLDFVGEDLDVEDMTMTGSLANYNWSSYSDIDLHVIVDFEDEEVLKKFSNAKRIIWNSKHDIEVYDFEVEIYIQDATEPHYASGVYSIMYDEWIVPPQKENIEIPLNEVLDKANQWMEIIDDIEVESEDKSSEESLEILNRVKNKLKKFRSCGLEKEGEYSIENLTFKFLRRNGYIKKLIDLINNTVDEELSLS